MNTTHIKGFTLIELMITIIITAILAAIGAPAMSDWINKTKLESFAHGVGNDLNETRDKAILDGATQEYTISTSDAPNISVIVPTTPSGLTSKISFNERGQTAIGGRHIYTVKSSKVNEQYQVVIPAYGTVVVRKK